MLTNSEVIALNLIKDDLVFLLTIFNNQKFISSQYFVAMVPYIGVIIDGTSKWGNKVADINKLIYSLSEEEKHYYEITRNTVKLWETSSDNLLNTFESKYQEAITYFSNVCHPFAKKLELYDVYGAYIIDEIHCDNTILDSVIIPNFSYENFDGEYIKNMSTVIGGLAVNFNATHEQLFQVDNSLHFITKDYGGFKKSPLGNKFSINFILYSLMCSINFVIHGINRLLIDDIPIKLRSSYLMYYGLKNITQILKENYNIEINYDGSWQSDKFRNCMAHYAIGPVMSQKEINKDDKFGGVTDKFFSMPWSEFNKIILKELMNVSSQLNELIKTNC